jgi:neutral ceramidase
LTADLTGGGSAEEETGMTTTILSFIMLTLPASTDGLTGGAAVVDITPPIGYRLCGYFNERVSTAVHDPLQAKALVLTQGTEQVALVFCDLIAVTRDVSSKARELAGRKTGIPAANMVITGTHTHTGPLFAGALRDHLHKMAVARNGTDPCEKVDYPAELVTKLVDVIVKAKTAQRPVTLTSGSVDQSPPLSFNRRYHMKDGSVRFNPGQLNAEIVRAAGPIDPAVGIVLIKDAVDGRPLASVTSFALHLDTTGGTEYSADYPFYLERGLRESLGTDFVSMFATGCCGDINHIDVTTKDRRKAEEIGALLAKTVREALPKLRPIDQPAIAARSKSIQVPLQQFSPEEVAQAEKDITAVGTRMPFLDQVRACKILDRQLRPGPTLAVEVQVFRLGPDVGMVTLPGEVFVELGLAIKKVSPFKITLVGELANDSIHYVPTRKAFSEGSYETVNSIIRPGGGEMMVDAAISAMKELSK